MILRAFLAATGLAIGFAAPAQALDLNAMSAEDRDTLRGEIRDYILDNPEIVMEALAILEEREQEAQADADRALVNANREALFEDGHSWIGGNPDGDITLVEFLDYRCGFCRRAFPEVESFLELDGNVRLIIKEFPILGEESTLASRFAIATQQVAGDEAYKSIHDALMTLSGPINDTTLTRLATSLGLDAEAILAHMPSDAVSDVITSNQELAQRLMLTGTPSFVMNTEMLRGYLPVDGLLEMADAIRAQ